MHWSFVGNTKNCEKRHTFPRYRFASDLTADIRRETVFRCRLAGHGPYHQSAAICECERQQSKPGLKSSRISRPGMTLYWPLRIIVKECNENMYDYSRNTVTLLPPSLITRCSMWHILIDHQSSHILGHASVGLIIFTVNALPSVHDPPILFPLNRLFVKYITVSGHRCVSVPSKTTIRATVALAHSTHTVPLFSRT